MPPLPCTSPASNTSLGTYQDAQPSMSTYYVPSPTSNICRSPEHPSFRPRGAVSVTTMPLSQPRGLSFQEPKGNVRFCTQTLQEPQSQPLCLEGGWREAGGTPFS